MSTGLTSFDAWTADFDRELQSARFWRRTLLVSSAATIALVGLLQLPPLRGFFGLDPRLPVALVALRLAAYAGLVAWEVRRGTGRAYFAAGALGMGFAFQLVMSSLVVSAEPPGAFVLAVLSVVGGAYNIMILRGTPRFPWPALAHAGAMAIALALRPTTPYVQIFAVAGPLAVGSGLFLGGVAESMARSRRLLEEARRAIAAAALDERSGEAKRLSSTLLELLQWNHEASSALSTALLDAEYLADLIRRGAAGGAKEIHLAARGLRDALRRVAHQPAGDAVGSGDPSLGAVVVVPAIRSALADVARLYGAVAFDTKPACDAAETAEATLRGGSLELERIVAELAKNACEGNGARGATRVRVEVDVAPGFVHVRIADDGPGFSDPILGETPTAFLTTKPLGSGLGLYTTAGVLRASGGSISLANAPEGGAIVTLHLVRR
ncbi:MAG TPA: sensor histidine kinase [Myxococcota bacterium]|nr:sensor histidine kinase [Myxococcota bacterium]